MRIAGTMFLAAAVLAAVGCKTTEPLFCDEEHPCEDPERPFCDINGEYPASEGVSNTCIPHPTDASVPDASVSTDAPQTIDATTIDAPMCTTAQDCDDGLFCNGQEVCTDGQCESGAAPTDDSIECTVDTCDDDTNQVAHTPDDSQCDNQDMCDGMETCDPQVGCVAGDPVQCPADTACTAYSCVPSSGTCVANDAAYSINYTADSMTGTVGLTCNSEETIYTSFSDPCTRVYGCEMNDLGEVRVTCEASGSSGGTVCACTGGAEFVSSGCSSLGSIECCFP